MKKPKSSPWELIVREFELQLRADGKSDATVSTYLSAVKQFTNSHNDVNSTNAITQKSVNEWLVQFDARKGTLNLKKNALRKFLSFLKTERGFKKEIVITIKDLQRPEPQFLTIAEQDKFLQYARGIGEVSQYYVMLKLMLFSGMRISEVINLKFSDIEGNSITLRQTKHGNLRRKHLKNEIAKMLKQYILARRNK